MVLVAGGTVTVLVAIARVAVFGCELVVVAQIVTADPTAAIDSAAKRRARRRCLFRRRRDDGAVLAVSAGTTSLTHCYASKDECEGE